MSGPDAIDIDTASAATSKRSTAYEALRQDARHFGGLSTREAERRRAEIFASLGTDELPADLWPVVTEELRTSLSPTVLAGVARAIRLSQAAHPDIMNLMKQAVERISRNDEYVTFASDNGSTLRLKATQELAATIAALSNRSVRCCGDSGQPETPVEQSTTLLAPAMQRVVVETQSGTRHRLTDLLCGQRTIFAFFYTRCMNPTKCSLTVTRLATIARDLEQSAPFSDLRVLACTYDPDFDLGFRLEAYGHDRGFPFTEKSVMVRCVESWEVLRDTFRLRVGYSATTVNDHARDVFLVGPELDIEPLSPESLARPLFVQERGAGSDILSIGAIAAKSCCCG
ncbi:SCO family protein [Rhizobium sp. BT-175]|uniref:SCO family protein n=1 Tax=Rhizobium sp. BT-175 TaxID=2986929 RepID=UPI002235AD05|nr:SCO family protein [Rhizobium sp. BT-175]MCV9945135.1 SCO family protein [Rhizobium sp. BT-175]